MKKYIIIPLILAIALSFITIKYGFDSNKEMSIYYSSGGEYNKEMNNLQTVVDLSDLIVRAKLEQKTLSKDSDLVIYKFIISDKLLGNVESNAINVYADGYELNDLELKSYEPLFEEGTEYFLFLEAWEDEYYPTTIYNLVHDKSIIKLANNKMKFENEIFGEFNEKDDLFKSVEQSIRNSNQLAKSVERREVVTKPKDMDDLISNSEIVGIVEPIEMVFENEFVKLFNAKIVEGIKGETTEEFSIFLPSDVNIKEQYLVFGNVVDDIVRTSTREGSLYKKDSEEFNILYNDLQNHK